MFFYLLDSKFFINKVESVQILTEKKVNIALYLYNFRNKRTSLSIICKNRKENLPEIFIYSKNNIISVVRRVYAPLQQNLA
jgi:hypothetical protein